MVQRYKEIRREKIDRPYKHKVVQFGLINTSCVVAHHIAAAATVVAGNDATKTIIFVAKNFLIRYTYNLILSSVCAVFVCYLCSVYPQTEMILA